MLELTIIGNIGQDARIEEFNGRRFASFSVAHSEGYTDQSGQRFERTTWVNVTRPIRENDRLTQYLTRGTKVYLRGHLSVKTYQTKQGQIQPSIDVRCTYVELVGGKQESNGMSNDELPY